MKEFVLRFNTQKGFGDVSLLSNGSGTPVDTSDTSLWGTEAGAQIGSGIAKQETLPDGRVVLITVSVVA